MAELKFAYKGPKREVSIEVPLSLFGIKDSIKIPFVEERDSSSEKKDGKKKEVLDNPFRREREEKEARRKRIIANGGIFALNMILTAMKD